MVGAPTESGAGLAQDDGALTTGVRSASVDRAPPAWGGAASSRLRRDSDAEAAAEAAAAVQAFNVFGAAGVPSFGAFDALARMQPQQGTDSEDGDFSGMQKDSQAELPPPSAVAPTPAAEQRAAAAAAAPAAVLAGSSTSILDVHGVAFEEAVASILQSASAEKQASLPANGAADAKLVTLEDMFSAKSAELPNGDAHVVPIPWRKSQVRRRARP